tara:strand:+ start:1192 stop:1407 length:216 start_codon:yes stop_codon:yes gene_type:complete
MNRDGPSPHSVAVDMGATSLPHGDVEEVFVPSPTQVKEFLTRNAVAEETDGQGKKSVYPRGQRAPKDIGTR